MHRLGLALSGGGFRATLYHLGVVRFLRDAEILPSVTHINTVSGGSIFGAHLALNWDRYCGSLAAFDEAAGEIVRFVQLDVRNQIVRRFPFASAANNLRALLRMRTSRQLTRAGLLEKMYEEHLYGDVPLSSLPGTPRLNILATNLSEGCLCSFNRDGLLLQRRAPGSKDRFERVEMGLATVPMAVTASSAFPGFFPPLELSAWDVGAEIGAFSRQAFTDGGVYDNLGLRMFRCIAQSWVKDSAPLNKQDFLELDDVRTAIATAASLPEETPLRRLREKLEAHDPDQVIRRGDADQHAMNEAIIGATWEVIRTERLYQIPCFQQVELSDAGAQSLLNYVVESGREPEADSRSWLNRNLVEAALRQVIGKPCLRMSRQEFDGILVSDAGGKFKVAREVRRAGLISTALRSSDILMDRVWQLELEAFENQPGVLFFPISEVVHRAHDRAALSPAIQQQTARIRTDLDRFSDLEISALVQHGYCVARQICRAEQESLKCEIPNQAPWNPLPDAIPKAAGTATRPPAAPDSETCTVDPALQTARELRKSSGRRVWSTLLSPRDWTSYVWMVLVLLLAIGLPYAALELRERAQRQRLVLSAIAEMSPDYKKILELIQGRPELDFTAMPYKDVESLAEMDLTGFEVLSDTRIFDLRGWSDLTGETPAAAYARISVRRGVENTENTHLRLQGHTRGGPLRVFSPSEDLAPVLSRMPGDDGAARWELAFDFSRVPLGNRSEVRINSLLLPEKASTEDAGGSFSFTVLSETALLEVWMLLPEGRYCKSFEVIDFPIGQPERARVVVPHTRVQLALGTIATFRLIRPEVGYRYACRWKWSDAPPDE